VNLQETYVATHRQLRGVADVDALASGIADFASTAEGNCDDRL
jgi:hypothetical protein